MDEKLKKRLSLSIIILLILDIPFILYLFSLKSVAFDENFYKKEFLKYDVYSEFPDEDIDQINSDLLYYLKYDQTDEYVNIDLFNEKEKEHLIDVKNLMQKFLIFLNVIAVLLIILIFSLSFIDKKKLIKNLSLVFIWGGIITFADALCFGLLIKINFKGMFNLFHKMFFKAGTWLFDSNESLVRIYQERIFYDITFNIAVKTFILAFILILIGFLYNEKFCKSKNLRFLGHKNSENFHKSRGIDKISLVHKDSYFMNNKKILNSLKKRVNKR